MLSTPDVMLLPLAENGTEENGTKEEDKQVKPWNIFLEEPPEEEAGSAQAGSVTRRLLQGSKVLLSVFLFATVLGGAVIAKGTALFMTSQLRPNARVQYCDKQFLNEPGEMFEAVLPGVERVAWVWVLLFTLFVPELGVFLRSARIMLFKPTSWTKPRTRDLVVVLVAETLGAIGVAMLVFSVLPDLDVLKGVMITNCLCLIPAILWLLTELYSNEPDEENRNSISRRIKKRNNKRIFRICLCIFSIVCQLSGWIVWPLVELDKPSLWLIIAAITLTSFGWWENYVSKSSELEFVKFLAKVKARQVRARYPTYLIVSIWKLVVFYVSMMIIWAARGESVPDLYSKFVESFTDHTIPVYKINMTNTLVAEVEFIQSAPWLLLIQTTNACFCYVTAKCACRILVQWFSYALSVAIAVPTTLSILIIFCALRSNDPCYFEGVIPGYLFFTLPPTEDLGIYLGQHHVWVWLFWLASQCLITIHIWYPKCQRLATSEQLFVTPWYNGVLVDQSLALNRRIDDEPPESSKKMATPVVQMFEGVELRNMEEDWSCPQSDDAVPRLVACATMWHENREEMVEMLKSIMRMDEDQSARRFAREYFSDPLRRNKDYYEFETHIFFDDAFKELEKDSEESKEKPSVVNDYVRDLMATIDTAASHVHQINLKLEPPKILTTPYGGQLIWTLPGKTKLTVHLKDSSKIRHKKRWSQVMYMYYLLGFRLLELPVSDKRKDVIAENTYLLALDGDIDFRPEAVLMLVDLMKRDRNLGAACGRIHPIGSGPMVWYQKFEYAVGHWLQKATEHVIGCVLCSPGCFSLFRGSALMDTNVMRKYTTTSSEARHYVQYDQGEDRWLCTLLLQRGYRVEYCAASDSYTHAPEGFFEFFNQRRRWVPSTMANIMDVLGDYKRTVRANDNISFLYIIYQIVLLVGSILGPGTILLMLVGAFVTVFGWSDIASLVVNVIPILAFMLVCYFAKSNTQITVALVMSFVYCMVMIAVLIGILVQISDEGPLAPTSLFFFIVTGQLIIAGLLHPMEITCLFYGVIYYITVPSMYMLLIIYSLFNLNNVSWGTRDNAPKKVDEAKVEAEANKTKTEAKKSGGLMGLLDSLRRKSKESAYDDEGSFEFSLAGLFRCMFCTYPKTVDDKQQLVMIAGTLTAINQKIDDLERTVTHHSSMNNVRRSSLRLTHLRASTRMDSLPETNEESDSLSSSETDEFSGSTAPIGEYDVIITENSWIDTDEDLKYCESHFISEKENNFWQELIEEYLLPIKKDEVKESNVAQELKTLRDKCVLAFFMLNAMFVFALFLIQANSSITFLNIPWPLTDSSKTVIEFNYVTTEILISTESISLEPIGFLFLVSFALVLFVQFIAMIFHRLGTFLHILSTIKLQWYCTRSAKSASADEFLAQHAVEIARELQKLRVSKQMSEGEIQAIAPEENKSLIRDAHGIQRRPTIADLGKRSQMPLRRASLADAFEKRFFIDPLDGNGEDPEEFPKGLRDLARRRSTLQSVQLFNALQRRRSTLIAGRKSVISSRPSSAYETVNEHTNNPTRQSVVSFRDLND